MRYVVRFKTILLAAAVLTFAQNAAFPRNELTEGYGIPELVAMPSSVWASGAFSPFLNPANLYRLNRIGVSVATGSSIELNLLGVSGTVSRIGGVAGGILNVDTRDGVRKQGLFLGWGREFLPYLAAGLTVKTFASTAFDFNDTLLFDIGATFHPNGSLSPFFGKEFFRDRLFLSFALQNVGAHGTYETDEDLTLRLGFGYDIREIGTRLFVDKCFLSEDSRFAFGLEFAPPFFPWASLRISYDMNSVLAGVTIKGDDIAVHAGYSSGDNEYYIGFDGSFEKTRAEIAVDLVAEGIAAYDEAVRLSALPDDAGKLDSYKMMKKALDKFKLALFYDKSNNDAELNRAMVENALEDNYAKNIKLGEESLARRGYPSALVYFQRAAAIRSTREVSVKIDSLLTNSAVTAYIAERSDAIDQFMRDKKYLEAKQKVIQLLWVNPYDGRANRQNREIDRQLQRLADELYKQAQAQYDSEDYVNCIANLQKALTYRQDYAQARKLLEMANKEYADIALLNQARTGFQNGSYMNALTAVNKLLRTDPRNAEAKTLKEKILAAMRANLNTYLANGIEFYNNGDYEKAIAEFDKVLAVEPYNGVATDYRTKAVSKLEAIRRYQDTGN